MCSRRPKPPKVPPPEPLDSAIEQTAKKVVIGSKRKSTKEKAITPVTGRVRLGTQSLQIPLLVGSTKNQNLNYM
tara:strand:- start:59 stop:280 length:222 start_codon:yes stop_codon:yes gene_type:complete